MEGAGDALLSQVEAQQKELRGSWAPAPGRGARVRLTHRRC